MWLRVEINNKNNDDTDDYVKKTIGVKRTNKQTDKKNIHHQEWQR